MSVIPALNAPASRSGAAVITATPGPEIPVPPIPTQTAGAPLTFTFSAAIKFGTGTLTLRGPDGDVRIEALGVSPYVTISGNDLIYAPPQHLAYGAIYTYQFSDGAVIRVDGQPANYGWAVAASFSAPLSPVAVNLLGTPQDDRMSGSHLADVIDGDDGNDTLYGYGGNDLLSGGDGVDHIDGGEGDDKIHGGEGDDVLDGGIGNDELHGGAGRDVLRTQGGENILLGGDGDDQLEVYGTSGNPVGAAGGYQQLFGGAGNDWLTISYGYGLLSGGDGNDRLDGGYGDDILIGGAGLDTARYVASARRDFEVTASGDDWIVTDRSDSTYNLGRDTLSGVERIAFYDGMLALDFDGAAGQAYRIYRAAFDRAPDEVGLGYWIAALDRGASLDAVAGGFADSQEFRDVYGAAPSHAEVVTRLYRNVLDRDPDASGYAFWVDVLDSGRDDVAGVLASFSESAENVEAVAQLIGQGIAYQAWGG